MQFSNIVNLIGPAAQIILGIFVGIILNLAVQWKQKYHSKMNLRRALIAELFTTQSILNNTPDNETDISRVIDELPRTAYESNASDIGGLSRQEVNAVTRFYSIASGSSLNNGPAVKSAMAAIPEIETQIREIKSEMDNLPSRIDQNITKEKEKLRELEATLDSLRNAVVDDQLTVLEKRRKKAVDNLRENLEDSILVFVWKEILRTKLRTYSLINRLRTPNRWEDIPENQCITLVSIAHIHKNSPFLLDEFKKEVESENISDKLEECVDTRKRVFILLRMKNLLNRVDGKYKINEGHGGHVLQGYYNQLNDEIKSQITISWA